MSTLSTSDLYREGWRSTAGGNWFHPEMPPAEDNRRRLFSEQAALECLALDVAARIDDSPIPDGACGSCGAFECPDAPGIVADA